MGNADVQEFLISKATNPNDARDFDTWDRDRRKSGASNLTVGGEDDADGKLRGALAGKEGERWSALQEAGVTASNLAQQMQVLDELAKFAPTGPIQGRLVKLSLVSALPAMPLAPSQPHSRPRLGRRALAARAMWNMRAS